MNRASRCAGFLWRYKLYWLLPMALSAALLLALYFMFAATNTEAFQYILF